MKQEHPIIYDDLIFKNDMFCVTKICFWKDCSLWKDRETGLLKVLLSGNSFNYKGISTLALPNGERATNQEFWYLDDSSEELFKVGVEGKGYGFIDKNMRMVVSPKYNRAQAFHNGFAVVSVLNSDNANETYLLIDKNGKEYQIDKNYNFIGENSKGLYRVSDLRSIGITNNYINLAYFSDYENDTGFWGYIDTSGKEIIKPQYIFALDFEKELAIVCKGKWVKNEEGKYYSENEQWGMIDKTGRETVLCKFDEIQYFSFSENSQYLKAHYGGWKTGKWGIINFSGEWVVEPIFEDLDYEIFNDDCFAFYSVDKWSDPDDVPMGIYSISKHSVIFEPQFFEVDFLENGNFKVATFDKELNRKVEQIIDSSGKPLFKSIYTYLFQCGDYYITIIRKNNEQQKYGLIDRFGNEILSNNYGLDVISITQKFIAFKNENNECGLMNFDGKIIIEPKYTAIRNIQNLFLDVKIGGKAGLIDEGKYGLITIKGEVILPIKYKSISIEDDVIIAREECGTTLFKLAVKQ
ncbi:MAG: WG repeat-containing protein [Flavobacteriaceae bacterium]|jgi:hypothetical protein|nr:WG repeat-containing protein [Flavobacteriaceae bacterium]